MMPPRVLASGSKPCGGKNADCSCNTRVVCNNDFFTFQWFHFKTTCKSDRVDYTKRGILFLSTNFNKKS